MSATTTTTTTAAPPPLWRGQPLPDGFARRFWALVSRGDRDECWLWLAAAPRGYGAVKVRGRMERAHRVAYFLAHGHAPPLLRHECDVGLCCNPAHLHPGTHRDNAADRVARGRQARGVDAGAAKLDDDAVRSIRKSLASGPTLARYYGVSRSAIGQIRRRETWAHVA